jgi:D-xylose transport system permease protein
VLNASRGVPVAVLIFLGFVVVFDLVLTHTRYGRSIFAIGGNTEAARRAGIRVNAIRLSVFAIAGFMAAAGGVLAAARLVAVNQSSGSGDVLLNSIAAAVIGGTSLFGGRGSTYSALLGVLVIGSVSNGIDLIGLGAPIKLMITGAVLLAAVTIDAIARRTRRATGRQ